MPEMDGFALAEQIRAEPELVGATIMMLVPADRQDASVRCRTSVSMPPSQAGQAVRAAEHDPRSPQCLGGAAGGRPGPAPADGSRGEAPPCRPLEVLLAEDNLVNQRLAVRMLEKRGHRVTVADNGKEALAALEKKAFDLVLMDCRCRRLGGFEATELIRERERGTGSHLPVIALTAHAMKGDRERCLAAGMDAYVSKPIRAAELFAAVDEVMAAAPPAAAPAEGVLDFKAALEHVAGDTGLLRELAGVFVAEAPNMMAAIRDSLEAGDATRLRRAAQHPQGGLRHLRRSRRLRDRPPPGADRGGGQPGGGRRRLGGAAQALECLLHVLAGFAQQRDDAALVP